MDAAEVLRTAAREISSNGWCQGDYEHNGTLCAIGALRKVVFGFACVAPGSVPDWYLDARVALAKVMAEQFGITPPPSPIFPAGWAGSIIIAGNDRFAKDGAEIVACMEKAAVQLEEK